MALKLRAEIPLVSDDRNLLLSHSSQIQLNSQQIALRVTQQDLANQLVNYASITLLNNQLALKVSNADLANQLANYASITLLSNQIATRVSTTDYNGNTIASKINQTSTTIKLQASKIALEGIVTANSRFKILLDGSMEAINGKFSGQITALSGNIGNYSLSNGILTTTSTYQTATFTSADRNRLADILSGLIVPTSADWAKFDVNKDGVLSISDLVIVNSCVGGSLPNPMTFRTNTTLGQTSGDLVSELRGNHNNVLYGGSKISPSSIRTGVGLFDNVYLISGNTSYRLGLSDDTDTFGNKIVIAYSDYYGG